MKKSYEESIAQLELRITEMQEEFEEGIQENEAKLIKTNKDLDAERIKVEAYKVELEKIEDHALKQDEILEAEINLLGESVKEAKAQTKNKENDIIKMEVVSHLCIIMAFVSCLPTNHLTATSLFIKGEYQNERVFRRKNGRIQ